FFISRIGREARGITNSSGIYTLLLPKTPLSPPKTSHPEDDLLQVLRKRRQQRCAFDCVSVSDLERLCPPLKCLLRGGHSEFCRVKQHSDTSWGNAENQNQRL